MIDAHTSWQQACSFLASEDYDAALQVLTSAMQEAGPKEGAKIALYLASIHALYGESGVQDMQAALAEAARLDAATSQTPLAGALRAELKARTMPEVPQVERTYREAADPLARFHAFAALALAGQATEALEIDLPVAELPEHLRWRLRSWQADAQETLGQTQDAAHLYAEAAHLTSGLNRAVMLQEQAALLMNLGQVTEADQILRQARTLYTGRHPDEGLNLATWYYLHAQTQLQLGRPEQAMTDIQEASRLERQGGEQSYGVALVHGQVLSQMGLQERALAAFEEALRLAAEPDRPYALHELGVALLDLDRPVEAREKLEAVLADPEYPYQPEVLADMAECDYRLGRLTEAQQGAEQALAQGAVVPASLVLGSVAMEYYHLDDALEHYERVIREAAPESRDWIVGHQMAADVMAQQGFRNPALAYAHAQQALEHTPESDDWHVTLQEHLRRAEELMGAGGGRTLN